MRFNDISKSKITFRQLISMCQISYFCYILCKLILLDPFHFNCWGIYGLCIPWPSINKFPALSNASSCMCFHKNCDVNVILRMLPVVRQRMVTPCSSSFSMDRTSPSFSIATLFSTLADWEWKKKAFIAWKWFMCSFIGCMCIACK